MAISNKLLVTFNHNLIDEKYAFFVITTSEKYINSGAYTLDKPTSVLKAESAVFDGGRSLFVMFKKNSITKTQLVEQIEDEKISLKQVQSEELKDFILFRLFLYSLNNFNADEIKFNNVTGKFYITNPSWITKNKNMFKALSINVDQSMNVLIEAATFTKTSLFTNKKALITYPKYEFSNKNSSLKRVLYPENENVYIRKSLFGVKAEIPFFEFSPKKLKNNKVYYLYYVLRIMKQKFETLVSFEFANIDIVKTIGRSRDEKIDEYVKDIVNFKDINIVNWSNSPEHEECFQEIVDVFTEGKLGQLTCQKTIESGAYNIIYLHDKDYYEQNKYNDPYKNFPAQEVIQHITVEESTDKIINDNKAVYNTILKELLIKDDIINRKKISLDDWASFGFANDCYFGKEKEGTHYFMIVHKDGSFELVHKGDDFSSFANPILNKCSDYLTDNKGKEKTIIADSNGNIMVISRTQSFTLPSEEIFSLEQISRSKESREQYLSGVVDINLYNQDGKIYYNAGIQGYGMQTSIPKAALLYQVETVEGKNFIEELLKTMAVSFVKYKSFTVMPYPIKYLNEYIFMETKE